MYKGLALGGYGNSEVCDLLRFAKVSSADVTVGNIVTIRWLVMQ